MNYNKNKEQQIREWFETFNSDDYIKGSYRVIKSSNPQDIFHIFGTLKLVYVNKNKLSKSLLKLLLDTTLTVKFGRGIPTDKDISDCINDLRDVLLDKNNKYGNSFDRSIRDYGYNIILARLEDKINRLEYILKNGGDDEDTLFDIAGYCILALIFLKYERF